ncbi:phosphoadenosine phosphosulfate reductase family protein, partial [Salmonella enterica subsp. enterica serovar Infantis]
YNCQINKVESIRVFPLSNWTEQDIWHYICLENIDIVPLYLAAERPVLELDGMLMMVDDDRIDLKPGELIKKRMVSFPT